jgi:hypothetical protein
MLRSQNPEFRSHPSSLRFAAARNAETKRKPTPRTTLALSLYPSAFAVLSAVFLGGLFPQHERGGGGFKSFQLHPPHGFLAAKPFLRVKDFQPGQPPFAVVISRNALRKLGSHLNI